MNPASALVQKDYLQADKLHALVIKADNNTKAVTLNDTVVCAGQIASVSSTEEDQLMNGLAAMQLQLEATGSHAFLLRSCKEEAPTCRAACHTITCFRFDSCDEEVLTCRAACQRGACPCLWPPRPSGLPSGGGRRPGSWQGVSTCSHVYLTIRPSKQMETRSSSHQQDMKD